MNSHEKQFVEPVDCWAIDDTSCFLDPKDMPQVPPEVEERLHAEAIAILDSMLEENKERSIA